MILGSAETKVKRNFIFFFSPEKLLHKQNMSLPSTAQAPDICHFTDVPSITHPNIAALLQPKRAMSPHWWTRHSVWEKTLLPQRQNSNYNLLESNFFSLLNGFFYTHLIVSLWICNTTLQNVWILEALKINHSHRALHLSMYLVHLWFHDTFPLLPLEFMAPYL